MPTDGATELLETGDESAPSRSAASPVQPSPTLQTTVQVNDSHAIASYTNFCRVTGTPEELIVDFGLNKQPIGVPTEPIDITQRLVMNYYTAKRLLAALNLTIQRHEAAFGVLEIDINKRLAPSARR